jgi:uncharacterized protein DUF1810
MVGHFSIVSGLCDVYSRSDDWSTLMTEADLICFIEAQAQVYARVIEELTEGRKRTHWMWFVFPQLTGLGHSAMAQRYAIRDLEQAKQYLAHPILGARLRDNVRRMIGHKCKTAIGYPWLSRRSVATKERRRAKLKCLLLAVLARGPDRPGRRCWRIDRPADHGRCVVTVQADPTGATTAATSCAAAACAAKGDPQARPVRADVLLIDDAERRQADVGNFLLVQRHLLADRCQQCAPKPSIAAKAPLVSENDRLAVPSIGVAFLKHCGFCFGCGMMVDSHTFDRVWTTLAQTLDNR